MDRDLDEALVAGNVDERLGQAESRVCARERGAVVGQRMNDEGGVAVACDVGYSPVKRDAMAGAVHALDE